MCELLFFLSCLGVAGVIWKLTPSRFKYIIGSDVAEGLFCSGCGSPMLLYTVKTFKGYDECTGKPIYYRCDEAKCSQKCWHWDTTRVQVLGQWQDPSLW